MLLYILFRDMFLSAKMSYISEKSYELITVYRPHEGAGN